MRKMLLINASPRQKGTSFVLLQMCKAYLEDRGHQTDLIHLYSNLNNMDKLLNAIEDADTVILSGPCYINTYPADTIAFLEELSVHNEFLHGQSLYGIIQGGMPYAHTHESGLSLLDIFCRKYDMSFKGGFVMGMGAILGGQPVTKLPNSKTIIRQLNIFFDHIEKDEASPSQVYQKAQFKVPGFIYGIMAKKMNQTIDKDLRNHGIDVNQISPYLDSK
jgi:multimeric flavodoxin WrbA